jgi:tetratricopeptide (TPR) repeat protein
MLHVSIWPHGEGGRRAPAEKPRHIFGAGSVQRDTHAAIKNSAGGHAQLDALVKDQLRAWLLRETLAAAKAREGATEEAAADLYCNAASVATTFGEHDEALEYYAKALAIQRDVLGERHPDTAATGTTTWLVSSTIRAGTQRRWSTLQRRWRFNMTCWAGGTRTRPTPTTTWLVSEALEYYAKTLAIRRDVLGERHPGTAGTYNNMAGIAYKQGRHAEALESYAKALAAIRRDVLGERHPDTAGIYNNMAIVFENQGRYAEALEYYAKALAIKLEVQGERHQDTGNSRTTTWPAPTRNSATWPARASCMTRLMRPTSPRTAPITTKLWMR